LVNSSHRIYETPRYAYC